MVERGGLENRCASLAHRGFESLPLRLRLREHRAVYRVGHRAERRGAIPRGGPRLRRRRSSERTRGCPPLRRPQGRPPRPEVTTHTERRVPGIATHRARRAGVRAHYVAGVGPRRSRRAPRRPCCGASESTRWGPAAPLAGVLHRTTPPTSMPHASSLPTAKGTSKLRRTVREAHGRGDEFWALHAGDVQDPASHAAEADGCRLRQGAC